MMELIKSISSKILYFMVGIFLFSFILGWVLPVGLDNVTSLNYREYLFSTYTVFTQFGFLLFSFIIAFFINKEYTNKTILFYKLLSYSSLKFFLSKIYVLVLWSIFIIFILLLSISLFFNDFSLLVLMQFLLSSVLIQYILIIGLISMLSSNILLSIGFSVFYWITSVVLVSMSDTFKYIALFDASNELYSHFEKVINGGQTFISINDSLKIIIYLSILFFSSIIIVIVTNKRWLKLGVN